MKVSLIVELPFGGDPGSQYDESQCVRVFVPMKSVRIDWAKAAAELVIIVTGIMLALAADRWRESRQEDDLALAYISRLQSDIDIDLQAFRQTVAWARAIDESSLYVLSVYEGMDPAPAAYDLFAYHIFRASWTVQGRTTSATYQDLVSTGNLGLLSVQIRNAIADYYKLKDDYQERVERYEDQATSEYWQVPYIVLGPVLGPRIWEAIQGNSYDFAPQAGSLKLSDSEINKIVRSLRGIDDLERQLASVRNQMSQRKILFGERLPNAALKLAEILGG